MPLVTVSFQIIVVSATAFRSAVMYIKKKKNVEPVARKAVGVQVEKKDYRGERKKKTGTGFARKAVGVQVQKKDYTDERSNGSV